MSADVRRGFIHEPDTLPPVRPLWIDDPMGDVCISYEGYNRLRQAVQRFRFALRCCQFATSLEDVREAAEKALEEDPLW